MPLTLEAPLATLGISVGIDETSLSPDESLILLQGRYDRYNMIDTT